MTTKSPITLDDVAYYLVVVVVLCVAGLLACWLPRVTVFGLVVVAAVLWRRSR